MLTMKDMLTTPCSEICYELGTYFLAQKDLNEAVIWFYNAAYETESILDVHTNGDLHYTDWSNVMNCFSPRQNRISLRIPCWFQAMRKRWKNTAVSRRAGRCRWRIN